jgi:hypothetical protein
MMMKMTQTGTMSGRMAASHSTGSTVRAFLVPTSIITIITTTMTTTTGLGAIGA